MAVAFATTLSATVNPALLIYYPLWAGIPLMLLNSFMLGTGAYASTKFLIPARHA